MPLLKGQNLHNRYQIQSLLGQGGMGAVYRAWDISLDIPVAIKENLDVSPEAQKQFQREARILARLSHPNLPRVTDHFFISGQGQYLVMDFVEGEDLGSMLSRLGMLPEPQVLTWIIQICDALSYLHSQPSPIIHRDIKPNNIKIRPDGKAMLVDFGIAKVYDPRLATTIGAKAVTPGYSPPEQYGMGKTDPRSDIYALGATLYHLLTGQTPPESIQRVVGQANISAPRHINHQISPLVEQVILKAVEVTTDRRFQTVEELRDALTQPMPPVVTRDKTTILQTGPKPKRSVRIQWPIVAGLIGIVILLVLGPIFYNSFIKPPIPTPTVGPSALDTSIANVTPSPEPTYTPYPTLTPYPTYTSQVVITTSPDSFNTVESDNLVLCSGEHFSGNYCNLGRVIFPQGTSAVYATWQLDDALSRGVTFTRRWYKEGELILESSNNAGENVRWTPEDGRSYYVYLSATEGSGKRIFNSPSFPSGNYKFELLVNGETFGVLNFVVE